MPIYEYACPKCGAVREVMRVIEERDLPVYCECSESMERQLARPGLHFKGSGFYATDYKRKEKS